MEDADGLVGMDKQRKSRKGCSAHRRMDDYLLVDLDGKRSTEQMDSCCWLSTGLALGLGDLPVGECEWESWILARKAPDGGARRWTGCRWSGSEFDGAG